MHNICSLIKGDVKRLFANVISVIITLGLVIMPSIFAWYNTIACWNVFDNTGNLTVAVANTDEGYESDLVPLRINVGDQVVSALRANEDINWTFTTEEDAIDGAAAGRYYAAVVIPQSFSRDMMTFYSDDAQHASIVYYANEKKSAIAPKITAQGADSVSYQVNTVFAETLSELALGMAQQLSDYAEDMDAGGVVADLSKHIRNLSSQAAETAAVLGLYAQLADSAQALIGQSSELITAASGEATSIGAIAANGMQSASGLGSALETSTEALMQALESSSESFAALGASVDELFDTSAEAATECAAQMRVQSEIVADQAASYQAVVDALTELSESGQVPAEYQPIIEGLIDQANTTIELLNKTATDLNAAAERLESGTSNAQAAHDEVKQQVAEAHQSIEALRTEFEQSLKPQLEQIAADAETLAGGLGSSLQSLSGASGDLSSAAGSASGLLGSASGKINAATQDLANASTKLASLADSIDEALASGDAEQLQQILGADTQTLANALAAPVGIERTAVFPAENFGSAMAPLYTTLALFIGSLLILVVVKPTVSERTRRDELDNPKPRELFLGRFGVMALLSLAQSTVMGLGNMLFLQVQVTHPWLFMLCFWVAGLVFTFVIYALVAAFANLGKAIAVLLLIIQVTGCGGSFPLQILPGFVQALSPWLPATHVVNAMRAAMMGTYGYDFWTEIGLLLLFLIPAAIIGLVLRKPFAKFMNWYIEQVESSKLIG